MDASESQQKRSKLRQRHVMRRRRRGSMAVRGGLAGWRSRIPLPSVNSSEVRSLKNTASVVLRDGWWYATHNPIIVRSIIVVILVAVGLYYFSYVISGHIFPAVEVMSIDVGGMSVDDAEATLRTAWAEDLKIELFVGSEKVAEVSPDMLGVRFDALATARAARGIRLRAIPFGGSVEPVVEIDTLTAQNYLLDLAETVNIKPYNAGYEWRDGELLGVEGRNGRMMDVSLTVERLTQDAGVIIGHRRLELLVIPLSPEAGDPAAYMDEVRGLIVQGPQLTGYDPFTNEFFTWPVSPELYAGWLAAGPDSLILREDAFLPFLDVLNQTLNAPGEDLRYLAPDQTTNQMRQALAAGKAQVDFRVRYKPTTYEVVKGDTGFRIGRKSGIPFLLIDEMNEGLDWGQIAPEDEVELPSRDEMVPEPPIRNKRIVVDLTNQYLVAFENGEVKFEWQISSGVRNAPTSPGVFQILYHEELARGSSVALCNEAGLECGVWEMNWFMGIYAIMPGLVNGFHGAVLLPNGRYLGDGNLGAPYTFGCVMSSDDNAKALYDWAEVGTIVEIISDEYAPASDLGRLALRISEARNANT